jgi:hypothetical protein
MGAASTTWRIIKHPWVCRSYYLRPSEPLHEKASYMLRFICCESVCMCARLIAVGIGTLCGLRCA